MSGEEKVNSRQIVVREKERKVINKAGKITDKFIKNRSVYSGYTWLIVRRERYMVVDMRQVMASMEESMKLQNQARAERRAEKAAQEKKEFQEKLMRAATSEVELDGKASKVKGAEDAVQRDQLIGLMMAGF